MTTLASRYWIVAFVLGCLFFAGDYASARDGCSPPPGTVVCINSKLFSNDTGIDMVKGTTYRLHVTGHWTDWFVPCDARGPRFPILRLVMSTLRGLLRVPPHQVKGAHFLRPIGTLENVSDGRSPKQAFLIVDGMEWIPAENGRLYVFADDDRKHYGNNKGCLKLRVEKLEHAARASK